MRNAIRWILAGVVAWLVYQYAKRAAASSPTKGTDTSAATGSTAPTPGADGGGDLGLLLADVARPLGGYPVIDAFGNVSTVTPATVTAQPATGSAVPTSSGTVGPAPMRPPPVQADPGLQVNVGEPAPLPTLFSRVFRTVTKPGVSDWVQ